MDLSIIRRPPSQIETDVLVVSAFQKPELRGAALEVDRALDGALSAAISDGAFKGALFEAE